MSPCFSYTSNFLIFSEGWPVKTKFLFFYCKDFFQCPSVVDFQDFNEDENESDDENSECTSESEVEDENDASNEEDYTSSGEARTDGSDDEVDINLSAESLRKLLPCNVEEFEKVNTTPFPFCFYRVLK